MTLYEQYIKGQTEEVYRAIYALKEEAFSPSIFPDVEKVLTETFQRVAYNLDVIYKELQNIGYLLPTEFEYTSQRPIARPLPNIEDLLKRLESAVMPFGYVPLSLKMFYRIVGSCNFSWDYNTNEEYIWQFADPIQIAALDDLVNEVTDDDYLSDLKDYYKEEGFISLPLSADYLHKDNTSGGEAYAIKVTKKRSFDAPFLNEEHDTTFIDYLRICFNNCGFSRIRNPENDNDYQNFFKKVKPLLKKI